MKNNNSKPCDKNMPDNKRVCIQCKEKYRTLIENFLDHKIGYKELKQAILEINNKETIKNE